MVTVLNGKEYAYDGQMRNDYLFNLPAQSWALTEFKDFETWAAVPSKPVSLPGGFEFPAEYVGKYAVYIDTSGDFAFMPLVKRVSSDSTFSSTFVFATKEPITVDALKRRISQSTDGWMKVLLPRNSRLPYEETRCLNGPGGYIYATLFDKHKFKNVPIYTCELETKGNNDDCSVLTVANMEGVKHGDGDWIIMPNNYLLADFMKQHGGETFEGDSVPAIINGRAFARRFNVRNVQLSGKARIEADKPIPRPIIAAK